MKKLLVWLWFLALSVAVQAQPAAPAGPVAELTRTLDSMDVTHLWLAGHDRVDWRTGAPIGPASSARRHTHCSQFAAAAADRFGIYLLRPPEHSSVYLANAQQDWLKSDAGVKAGWERIIVHKHRVETWRQAAQRANAGWFVVAVYKNPDGDKSGHIAILRPSSWSADRIARHGPEIIQAGGTNYQSTDLETGFGNHSGAFRHGRIEFFAHRLSR